MLAWLAVIKLTGKAKCPVEIQVLMQVILMLVWSLTGQVRFSV